MIVFANRGELYNYLNNGCEKKKQKKINDEVYYLIEYEGEVHPYHFFKYLGRYIEWRCSLSEKKCTEERLEEYVRFYWGEECFDEILQKIKKSYKDGCLYELAFQLMPFYLDDGMKLIDVLTEEECIEWLMQNHRF